MSIQTIDIDRVDPFSFDPLGLELLFEQFVDIGGDKHGGLAAVTIRERVLETLAHAN